jgi:hypothetical protein
MIYIYFMLYLKDNESINEFKTEPECVNIKGAQGIDSKISIPPGYIGWRIRFIGIDFWAQSALRAMYHRKCAVMTRDT